MRNNIRNVQSAWNRYFLFLKKKIIIRLISIKRGIILYILFGININQHYSTKKLFKVKSFFFKFGQESKIYLLFCPDLSGKKVKISFLPV